MSSRNTSAKKGVESDGKLESFEDYSKGWIGVLVKLTVFLAAVAGTLPLTVTAEQRE